MSDEMGFDVIDAIYAAATEPDEWPAALEAIVGALNANSACFTTCALKDGRLEMLPIGIGEKAAIDYTQHYARIDPLIPAVLAAPRGRAYSDLMFLPRREMEQTETYRDWAVPNGIRSAAAMIVRQGSERIVTLAVMRERRDHEFRSDTLQRFERLAGHMQRALKVQERLGGSAANATALERLAMSVLSVSPDGRIYYANRSAEALLTDGRALRTEAGLLVCARPSETRMLRRLMRKGTGIMSLPRDRLPPLSIVAAPGAAGHGLLGSRLSARFLFISDPQARGTPPVHFIRGLFGLTPMQAAIALEIARGDGIDAAAARLGISRGTARAHLAQVFAKTRTSRQAELVRLLARSIPDLRDDG